MTVVCHHPWFLTLLLPLLLLCLAAVRPGAGAVPVSTLMGLAGTADSPWHRSRGWFWLAAGAAFWLVLGLSQPRLIYHSDTQEVPRPNLLWVLDLSGSMEASDWPEGTEPPVSVQAEDVPPSRLQLARRIIAAFLDRTPVSRSGLLAFAHQPYLICPLQRSSVLLRERLEQLQPADFADGTAIGEAVICAVRALQAEPLARPRIMVLLSDGADHSASQSQSHPLAAARLAAQHEVVIYTLGVGGPRGWHPAVAENGLQRWQPVGESLDEPQLRSLAELSGGRYFPAADAEQFLVALEALSQQVEQQLLSRPVWQRCELARYCLLLAALSLLLALIMRLLFPRLEP